MESCWSKSRQRSELDSNPVLPVSEDSYPFWEDKLQVSQWCLWSESPSNKCVMWRMKQEQGMWRERVERAGWRSGCCPQRQGPEAPAHPCSEEMFGKCPWSREGGWEVDVEILRNPLGSGLHAHFPQEREVPPDSLWPLQSPSSHDPNSTSSCTSPAPSLCFCLFDHPLAHRLRS